MCPPVQIDPRSPVIVGVGQWSRHLPAALSLEEVGELAEPVDMMAEALRRAGVDAAGGDVGGDAGRALLARAQRVAVVSLLSWRYRNPAALLAERIGARPSDLVLGAVGGNSPQLLVNRTAADIAAGRLDVAVIAGAEAMYARRAARRAGGLVAWTEQDASTPEPRVEGTEEAGSSPTELAVGLQRPIQYYPLFENALRHAAGESIDEHQVRVSELWSRFSDVAAGNPHAWSPVPLSPQAVRTVGPANRMVGFPYPKYMNANMTVDQAAGLILCSVDAARAAGIPEERWVYPHAGAEAHDHWFVSTRADLRSSPAIRLAGARALELAGAGIDDVDHLDLYSCFPAAVQVGAAELGLALDDPGRPLTVTGGLAFAGGPGNNYVTHSIATMCEVLRRDPGSLGLVTALGWYITKHAVGVYSTRPPEAGFRWGSVQDAVDSLPAREAVADAEGRAEIETYTVMHERDGEPSWAVVATLLADGRRALANLADPAQMRELTAAEGCGRPVRLLGGGKAELA